MSGRSQQDRIRRGVDRGSVAIYEFDEDHPVSVSHFIQLKLTSAIVRLCDEVVIQSHFLLISHAVGIIMIVGIRTFSIVTGSGLLSGLFREFVMWLPEEPGPR